VAIDVSLLDAEPIAEQALAAGELAARPVTPVETAPVSGWRRVLVDCAVVSSAEVVGNLLSSVTSVLLRMALSPAQMGIWQGLKIFLNYANYANLGVSKGAARDLAIAQGRGDLASAQRGLNLAFAVNTLTSLVYAAVLAAAGLWIGGSGGVWGGAWALGLVVVGVLAVLQRHLTFYVTILRSKQAFGITSQVSILEALLTLVLGGLGAWRFGLPGLYGGTILVMAGAILFVGRRGDVQLAWAWDTRQIGRLIAVGGPILLAGSVATLFRTLDKLMILGYLHDREFQLGCYSVALLVTTQLYGLANMLSIVMGPRYNESFGRTGSRRAVARLAARATELQSAAMTLPSALAIVAAPALLGWLLPAYRSGLAPLVWLIPGNLALAAALPPNQYLVSIDRQGRALAVVVAATLLAAAGNHLSLAGGYGLPGVAAATSLSYVAYYLLSVATSIWHELDAADRLRYVGMMALTHLPPIGLAVGLERLWPGQADLGPIVVLKIAAVLTAWLPAAWIGWCHGQWAQSLRTRVSPHPSLLSEEVGDS
jgi:O-antigen/teichoic acid export membrane protein